MNYWLGDHSLFPSTMTEWHSESLLRLDRCFLAWNPPPALPESQIDVPDISFSINDAVRFGSFNHHRKISDQTLRTWASLLQLIPKSKLVLKALHKDDSASAQIFTNRMLNAGLDPDQIIWIPRANSTKDHLYQYSLFDIGLDPFPNGGCTTTCEALWMGVPVVTLSGSTYVSRMSTAVLNGSRNSALCASTIEEYLSICHTLSNDVQMLRQSRDRWRNSILNSQLGNTSELINSLEDLFGSLVS